MSRILFLTGAWLSAALGTIGAFVPLLPTVPLYLLAALCFTKGSKRLHDWFVATKMYQKHLKGYAEGKGLTRGTKVRIMLIVSAQLALGYAFMGHAPIGRVALVCVWCGLMALFMFGIKTRPAQDADTENTQKK